MLKKIEVIIREEKLTDVKDALQAIGIMGMNVFEVRGRGRQGGIKLTGRSGVYVIDMLPRVQVNIVLSERNLDAAIVAIREAAYTGSAGDGVIFVYNVEEAIRVRTNERGADALMYPGDIDEKRSMTT